MPTVLAGEKNASPPEYIYRQAPSADRRRIQAEVIAAYRPMVARSARQMVQAQYYKEAAHVGEIGLLLALERYDAARGSFWAFASHYVRNEIEIWLRETVHARPRSHRCLEGQAQEERDSQRWSVSSDKMQIASEVPSPEELVREKELRGLLGKFLSELSDAEQHLLLCAKRTTNDGGVEAGNNLRSRGYISLMKRATAFLKGGK